MPLIQFVYGTMSVERCSLQFQTMLVERCSLQFLAIIFAQDVPQPFQLVSIMSLIQFVYRTMSVERCSLLFQTMLVERCWSSDAPYNAAAVRACVAHLTDLLSLKCCCKILEVQQHFGHETCIEIQATSIPSKFPGFKAIAIPSKFPL